MNIDKLVNEFYTNKFGDTTELVVNSVNKEPLLKAISRYNNVEIGYYKISTILSWVVEQDKQYYSLRFMFDKKY